MNEFIEKFKSISNEAQNKELLNYIKNECTDKNHITAFGVGKGHYTIAALAANPAALVAYDWKLNSAMQPIVDSARTCNTDFSLIIKNVLELDIALTDSLIITTKHTFNQLSQELFLHGDKVKESILIPKYYTYEYINEVEEVGKREGLKAAVEEFLQMKAEWKIEEKSKNLNIIKLTRC